MIKIVCMVKYNTYLDLNLLPGLSSIAIFRTRIAVDFMIPFLFPYSRLAREEIVDWYEHSMTILCCLSLLFRFGYIHFQFMMCLSKYPCCSLLMLLYVQWGWQRWLSKLVRFWFNCWIVASLCWHSESSKLKSYIRYLSWGNMSCSFDMLK